MKSGGSKNMDDWLCESGMLIGTRGPKNYEFHRMRQISKLVSMVSLWTRRQVTLWPKT